MANSRRSYSAAEELALATQVGGYCPLCGANLFYRKGRSQFKGYDLAHVFPLNPTDDELSELSGVALLNDDVNHPDNLICLCKSCHTQFDKPRTRQEYESLYSIKKKLIQQAAEFAISKLYPLEAELSEIVSRLHENALGDGCGTDLEYDPKRVDDKLGDKMPAPTQRKIKHNVADYYPHLRAAFRELEQRYPNSSQVIFSQVRSYYTKQKALQNSQAAIFANIVAWIRTSTKNDNLEAAEATASFFVQNCEVFD